MGLKLFSNTIDRLRGNALTRVFTDILPELQPLLEPYLTQKLPESSVSVKVTFADNEHLKSLGLQTGVMGVHFILSEIEEPVAINKDDGDVLEYDVFHNLPDDGLFEVVINVPEHLDFIHSQITEDEAISILSTVPHEIIHALTFAIASHGKTPCELYDDMGVAGISEIADRIEDKFGSFDDEELMTERMGLAIARMAMTDTIYLNIMEAGMVEPVIESCPVPGPVPIKSPDLSI